MSNNIDSIIDSDDIILNFSKISNTSLKNNLLILTIVFKFEITYCDIFVL